MAVLTRKLTPGLAFSVVMIGLGLLLPVAAVLGYGARRPYLVRASSCRAMTMRCTWLVPS